MSAHYVPSSKRITAVAALWRWCTSFVVLGDTVVMLD